MAGTWFETHRNIVQPWLCDQFGHMNVRWYAHFFDDAAYHVWTAIGFGLRQMEEKGFHTVVAQTRTDFVQELHAGQCILVKSAFTRLGGKSVTYRQELFDADVGTLHARQEAVEVFFDPKTRKSDAIPEEIRAAVGAALVDAD